jgi:hypothetical protein
MPAGCVGWCGCLALLPRHELGHVQIATGSLADLGSRGRLIQMCRHAAVGQTHVAQQALGVVAQGDRQLAQVAGDLAALQLHLAGSGMGCADDCAGLIARVRSQLLCLGLGVGPSARQFLLQQFCGLSVSVLQGLACLCAGCLQGFACLCAGCLQGFAGLIACTLQCLGGLRALSLDGLARLL